MSFASQSHIERWIIFGTEVLEWSAEIVATSYGEDLQKPDHDRAVGRELIMAVFMAARGDAGVNRLYLIEGMLQAVGEAMAQQPPGIADEIRAAVLRGMANGQAFQRGLFTQAAGKPS